MERIKKLITRNTFFIVIIVLLLFSLPFFWFKPGEMDLGGDSSRLYFYDPLAYLKNYAFYGISPSAFGAENIGYFMVPFVGLLFVLKFFLNSPTLLIAFFHGVSLSIAFLACYGNVRLLSLEVSKKKFLIELIAIISGLFYVFSPMATGGWDKVLVTHNQFFLNPLIFFLLLNYLRTDKTINIVFILLTTFLFAPNFSFAAAPGFFAFYPLSILFLLLYRLVILKRRIIWKHLLIGFSAFIFLQAFHILPQLTSMFSPGSVLNTTVFSTEGKFERGLNYFVAIAPSVKTSLNIMSLPQGLENSSFLYLFILFPIIIIAGLLFNRTKILLLIGIFFLIVLFFSTANITNVGFELYKQMFNLPGFSIFRNFYGQWQLSLLFFYTLLFGLALISIFEKVSVLKRLLISLTIILILFLSASTFITGSLFNKVLWQSNNIRIFMEMDPQYEELLRFVTALPVDGKVLTLPLTDPGYQIIVGTNNGAYQGPSTISYLAGKQDFTGIQEFGEFRSLFEELVKEKKYEEIKQFLGFLNIKYIVYNADSRIYDDSFPTFPYNDVRRYFPTTQKEYKEFLEQLSLKEVKNVANTYYIFELTDESYRSNIYTSQNAELFTKNIDKWNIPFLFSSQNKVLYFEFPQTPRPITQVVAELDKNSIFSQIIKNPDPPRFLHNAFAKTSPTSLLYKPAVIKEYLTLQRQYDSYHYIDQRMFLSTKILVGLERWGHVMPVFDKGTSGEQVFKEMQRTDQERTLQWELQHTNNSWESLLKRYARNFIESISYIEASTDESRWKEKQKFLVYEYILNHKYRFNNIMAGSTLSAQDKAELLTILDKSFDYWLKKLELPDLTRVRNLYSISMVDQKDGIISLYIKKDDFDKLDPQQFGLFIDGQELQANQFQDEINWIKLDTSHIDFSKPKELEILTKSSKNLINTSEIISLYSENPVTIDVKSKIRNGLVWKIKDWKPDSYYLLSFEYKNEEVPYNLRFYESHTDNPRIIEAKELFSNQLDSSKWKRYQAVVKSGKDANVGFIQIERDSVENFLAEFEIKDVSLTYIPQPTFIIKATAPQPQVESLPNITFAKINPTKYQVMVTNSKDPYYLVFNQAYNNRWKVFLDETTDQRPKQQFFDLAFSETFDNKPLFENSHYSVNGGMNAWYIDPKILGDKNSYSFIIEFTAQRYFYIGFLISFITFVGVVVYTIYSLFRREK